jgi:hypothetical protein
MFDLFPIVFFVFYRIINLFEYSTFSYFLSISIVVMYQIERLVSLGNIIIYTDNFDCGPQRCNDCPL